MESIILNHSVWEAAQAASSACRSSLREECTNKHGSWSLSEPASLCAAGRCREAEAAPAATICVAREGIFARRAKTNLPMCLKPRERLSLGRFAERVSTWLNLPAAEVPCKTAPFASFSGRAEKEGPARPERVPMSSSVVKAIKKANVTQNYMKLFLCILTKQYPFFSRLGRLHGQPLFYF